MKPTTARTIVIALFVLFVAALPLFTARSAAPDSLQVYEYATLRWSGVESTHLIRPNGKVETLGPLFPDIRQLRDSGLRVDERALCMTIAINAIAKEGYEVASATENWVVLRRPVSR